ncbi:MAG: glycosyltransferase family 4 protein [Gammaproteobacteria bacterium]
MRTHSKRVLCLTSYYLPGVKSGGPLRSLLHMQEWLGSEYEFSVLTRNRDLGETEPYADLERGGWHTVSGLHVCYLPAPQWRPGPIRKAIREARPNLLYFHSSVDFSMTIVPLLLRRLGLLGSDAPVIVAPRGEYSPGARSIKRRRKRIFFRLARLIGLYRDVTWHATKEKEAEQIRSLWGDGARIHIAANLPSKRSLEELPAHSAKATGPLRLVFLSRISRMKNLDGALAILRGVTVDVALDIFGAREDPQYWAECQQLMGALPSNVVATYRGIIPPDRVIETLSIYDAFFLPTLGENFGHVILEALLAGCPVILSDQTPWRELAGDKAGFDLPLGQPERFVAAIHELAAMTPAEHGAWSQGARRHGAGYASNVTLVDQTRRLLSSTL